MYLLDTNVISEFRKGKNANWGVRQFFKRVDDRMLFLPVQVLGEIRAGIAKLERNGAPQEVKMAKLFERWLDEELLDHYAERIVELDADSAQLWGMLLSGKKDPHTIDKQIAAMAMTREMIVVTGDKGEAFTKIKGCKTLNPFRDPPDDDNDETFALAA